MFLLPRGNCLLEPFAEHIPITVPNIFRPPKIATLFKYIIKNEGTS